MRLKRRPYHLLLPAALLLFVAGLIKGNAAMDIYLHDTYFFLPLSYLIWAPCVLLLFFWVVYLASKQWLYSETFTWIHVLLTIVSCIFFVATPFLLNSSFEGLAGMPRRYYNTGQYETYHFLHYPEKATIVIIVLLVVGQLTYFLNLIIGLSRHIANRKTL